VRTLTAFAVAAALACGAGSALAQPKRNAGLWEVQNKVDMPGMPSMDEMMKQVPPEQRAMMEQMMKQRGVAMGSAPNTFRYCLSKKAAERDVVPPNDPDMQCSHKLSQSSASEAKFSFSCKRKDGSTAEGEGRAYDLTPSSYASEMTMRTQQQGQAMTMKSSQKGKWLGADCQGLKPIGE